MNDLGQKNAGQSPADAEYASSQEFFSAAKHIKAEYIFVHGKQIVGTGNDPEESREIVARCLGVSASALIVHFHGQYDGTLGS